MKIFQIHSIVPIAKEANKQYTSITFDGLYFYMLNISSKIVSKFNNLLDFITNFEVERTYTSICYDSNENCFWACCSKIHYHIYKLNSELKEIDMITIKTLEKGFGSISSLSYDYKENKLVISYSGRIISVEKKVNTSVELIQNEEGCVYKTTAYGMDCFISAFARNNINNGSIFSKDNNLLIQFNLPIEYSIVDIVLVNRITGEIYILVSKNSLYFYIIKCTLTDNDILGQQIKNLNDWEEYGGLSLEQNNLKLKQIELLKKLNEAE